MWEDLNSGKNYKSNNQKAIIAFIKDCNMQSAFNVYEAFFDAYWIGIHDGKNPFIELVQKMKSFEAATLLIPVMPSNSVTCC